MRQALELLLEVLREPTSAEERKAGWTANLKAGYLPVFEKLLIQIENGETPPYFGIARSLDSYGLGSGELCEMMYRIANEANDQLQ